MLTKLKAWNASRIAAKKAKQYKRGYGHAAAEMLTYGEAGRTRLDNRVDESISVGRYGEFDRGVQQAIRDYYKIFEAP